MAASTSTTISSTNSTTQACSNGPLASQKMPASEVGWCFVHEYYTFLNKEPSRLHCFYGQKSTLIHGTEGEAVTPSQGEKEIKEKFQGLNLENCRVLVTNVDSQASINGGILIQVLGEISNRNEIARRFAQTFFLDVQPNVTNGYYVLNDIIRFLSDDDIEIYNGGEEAGASTSPTGTLVEEPINRVEQSGLSNSAQNMTITESPRTIDANIMVLSSKENEVPLQTVLVNGEVDSFVNNGPASTSIIPNTNMQPSKPVQPVQNRPQNHNGQQMVGMNKQEPATTQETHVNGQTLSIQTYPSRPQSTPVVSTNIQQPSTTVTKQEPAAISVNVESQSLQALKANVIISEQEQSPTVNASQGGQVSGTQSPPVMQNKTWHPANISKQIPIQSSTVSIMPQPRANSQLPVSVSNFNAQVLSSIPKSYLAPNNDNQSQAVNTSQVVQDNNNVEQLVNTGTTQADKKSSMQNFQKNDVIAGANPEVQYGKLPDNHTSQVQVPTKKTWASLAANEPEKWNSNALAEAKGVVSSVSTKPVLQAVRDNRNRRLEGQKNNNRRNSDTSLSIYVKGVTPSMSYEQLKAAFMSFGIVKHLDVVHARSCAFVEYNNTESYCRALEAHTVDVGGEIVHTEERRPPIRRNNSKVSRGHF